MKTQYETDNHGKKIAVIVPAKDFVLTEEEKAILDERLQENEKTYLSAEESITQLNKKYG